MSDEDLGAERDLLRWENIALKKKFAAGFSMKVS